MAGVALPSPQRAGIALALLSNLISAVFGVFLASWMQTENPFLLMLCMTGGMTVFFWIYGMFRQSGWIEEAKAHFPLVVLFNVSTLASWICWFYAMELIEPAIVQAVSLAIGPVVLCLFGKWLRPPPSADSKRPPLEGIGTFVALAGVAILTYHSLKGKSSLGTLPPHHVVFGIVQSVLTGLGVLGNTLCSKKLLEHGARIENLMVYRFPLLLLVGLGLTPLSAWARLAELDFWAKMTPTCLLGTILPIYLIQLAIQRTESLTLSLLLMTVPVMVYFVQFFDPRLAPTASSLGGILLCLSGTFLAIASGHRLFRRLLW